MHTNLYTLIGDDDSSYTRKGLSNLMGTNTLVFDNLSDYCSLKNILKSMRKNKEPRVIFITTEINNSYLDHKAIIRECQIQHKTLYTIIKATSKNGISMIERVASLYENSFDNEEVRERLDNEDSLTKFVTRRK